MEDISEPVFLEDDFPSESEIGKAILDPNQDITHKQISHLSRRSGGTKFSKYRMRELNIGFHGDVLNAGVNWYFVWSKKSDVLMASGPKERKYLISMFTPTKKVLDPYQKIDEYDDQSRMCKFSSKEDAIKRLRAFGVTGDYVNPQDFRWF